MNTNFGMSFNLLSDFSFAWMIVVVAVSIVLAWLLYYKKPTVELLPKQKALLFSLRLIVFVIIGFLLLNPTLRKIQNQVEKPIIFFAQDNSESIILSSDSAYLKTSYQNKVNALVKDLEADYIVRKISFGKDAVNGLSFVFNDAYTNFSKLFALFNTQYYNQNIGALILATDGIFNQGAGPEVLAKNLGVPIYPIVLGDTLQPKDIYIKKTVYNKKVVKGSTSPLIVHLMADGLVNKKTSIHLYKQDRLIESIPLNIDENNYFSKVTFNIKNTEPGFHQYRLKIDEIKAEQNLSNNNERVFIEVDDKKKNILFIQNGWHPDTKAVNSALSQNESYQLNIVSANSNLDTLSIKDYSLIILHRLPSAKYGLSGLFKKIKTLNTPVLYILGEQTSIKALNQLNANFQIKNFKGIYDNTNPIENENFNLFKINGDLDVIKQFPPLSVPFGEFSNVPASAVLLHQGLNDLNTYKPLVFFSQTGSQKVGYIAGEGIWRWMLKEYAVSESHEIVHQLIYKSIQYLLIEANTEQFVVDLPNLSDEEQPLYITARLYNASNELTIEPDVSFVLINGKGEEFPYFMKKMSFNYNLSINGLQEGKYTYIAKTELGAKHFEKTGEFIIRKRQLERISLVANHNLLNKMALNSGDKTFTMESMLLINDEIRANKNIYSKSYSIKQNQNLIDRKLIFVLVLLLLSIEWLLRKLWGIR